MSTYIKRVFQESSQQDWDGWPWQRGEERVKTCQSPLAPFLGSECAVPRSRIVVHLD
jgi:hypothetical protein